MFPRFLHVVVGTRAYGYTAPSLSLQPLMDTGCFHLLAVVTNASVITYILYKYILESLYSIRLGVYLGVELLGHVETLCLAF